MGYSIRPIKNINYIIDYYFVFSLDSSATEEEIKKQYKKLVKEYHPDKFHQAGQEIKDLSAKKMKLIIEGYKVLSGDSKNTYDNLLMEFKKDQPGLVSKNGAPILDVRRESASLDFLVSGETEFDFKQNQESKVNQLVGYNETVFNTIETAYLAAPSEDLKAAYLDQLIRKKMSLDWEETFAWQEIGLLNNAEVDYQLSSEYLEKIEEKILKLKQSYENQLTARLLPGNEVPFLLEGSMVDEESLVTQLPVILDKIDKTINDRSKKLLGIANRKKDLLSKMAKVRTSLKIQSVESKNLSIVLVQKDIILTTFTLTLDESETKGSVAVDAFQDGLPVSDIKSLSGYNTYQLEFNQEIPLVFQVMEFFNELSNT